jgi:S-adenosyl-L-methionine hydrolase (adenosine-forming)
VGNAAPTTFVVSLLTDYGLGDGFVGALHSVLRRRVPLVPIVDLSHTVAPLDVRAGSLALRRAAPYLAPGVVVAVVDPGVGTNRRAVAVATPEVAFVGPDNGLLVPAVDALGGASEAVELEDRGYWLKAPGPTFAGRDIFAPAAGELAAGGALAGLGPAIEVASLARLPAPVARWLEDGTLDAEVTWVDGYGNAQLAAGPDGLSWSPVAGGTVYVARLSASGPGHEVGRARVVKTFADLAPGQLGLLVDSFGCWALCLYASSAALYLGIEERDVLHLRPVAE